MGFDLSGKAPTSEAGVYFRNNVWWWRPLWDYVENVAPELASKVRYAQSNDGDGLGAEDAEALARMLTTEIESGRTAAYAASYTRDLDALPDEVCYLCQGEGVRHDGATVRELRGGDSTVPDDFPCNACNGTGHMRPWATSYPFSVENVQEFRDFVAASGGFAIW